MRRASIYERPDTSGVRVLAGGKIILRAHTDNLPQQWWFASTAIPLIAATIGPLSNVLSIAALVSPWRLTLPNSGIPFSTGRGSEDAALGIADPEWELIFNGFSLACGFAGNLFLLLHFTSRVRYIVALPLAILCWLLSAAIPPYEVYSQGFWHAILASGLYLIGSGILTINIVGYFRGHYPQQFALDDDQRTLILQTTTFFFWLAGGSGVFAALEGFTYADALYYADVSILTVGFGDFAPATDPGRGFLFVFQLIGIVFLGLVISSISKFALNISADKIIKQHQLHARESTVGRAVTSERELRERLGLPPRSNAATNDADADAGYRLSESGRRGSLAQYGRLKIVGRTSDPSSTRGRSRSSMLRGRESSQEKRKRRRQKLLLLQKERDRFDAMRQIQRETRRWKQYWALGMAFLAFGILWCLGAFVFMLTENHISHLRYFDCLYFCFVALLTIGYGDISPKSNIGKPFFIVWSLVAVPIVTLLIQEMSNTIVSAINRGTFKIADWTIMPRKGVLQHFLNSHPALSRLLGHRPDYSETHEFTTPNYDPESEPSAPCPPYLSSTPPESDPPIDSHTPTYQDKSEHDLALQLSQTLKSVAHDLRLEKPKRYTYAEWSHFTKLMRFSSRRHHRHLSDRIRNHHEAEEEEEDELIEWDWIGENSPMLADITEAEWILDRLCESLGRYTRRQAGKVREPLSRRS
ncbi:hypothetical protein B0T16DRAFT_509217 [Cercophora newfieldiana]|uniref:Potassium channel domain-containing protein n=1 Tax=Cercophora newfieldiana TaxID=92897 RepID=A0AA39Y5X7_9PEZI|nr:hypothetical protein B0T16DRAFT_509217 [Cercophora newfieldiana]